MLFKSSSVLFRILLMLNLREKLLTFVLRLFIKVCDCVSPLSACLCFSISLSASIIKSVARVSVRKRSLNSRSPSINTTVFFGIAPSSFMYGIASVMTVMESLSVPSFIELSKTPIIWYSSCFIPLILPFSKTVPAMNNRCRIFFMIVVLPAAGTPAKYMTLQLLIYQFRYGETLFI